MATREPDLSPAGPVQRRGHAQLGGSGGRAGIYTQCIGWKLCPSDSDTVALQALTPFPATNTGSANGPAGVRLTLVLVLTVVLELT